jgi:hypothetical protein
VQTGLNGLDSTLRRDVAPARTPGAPERERRSVWRPVTSASRPCLPKAAHAPRRIEVLPCHVSCPPPRRSAACRVPPVRPLSLSACARLPRMSSNHSRNLHRSLRHEARESRQFKAAPPPSRPSLTAALVLSPPRQWSRRRRACASAHSAVAQPARHLL